VTIMELRFLWRTREVSDSGEAMGRDIYRSQKTFESLDYRSGLTLLLSSKLDSPRTPTLNAVHERAS